MTATTTPSYATIVAQLTVYRRQHETTLTEFQKGLLTEAQQLIRDLETRDTQVGEGLASALNTTMPVDMEAELGKAAGSNQDAQRMLDLLQQFSNVASQAGSRRLAAGWIGDLAGLAERPVVRDLRLNAEAYYEAAHKLLDRLQRLPDLKNTACTPIRIVRNKLLVHPEKDDSGVVTPSFAYTAEAGPIIKGTRMSGQAEIHPDRGFYPNRADLLTSLDRALTRALQAAPK